MNKYKLLGVGGAGTVGKDLFCGIASNILKKYNYIPIKIAFADKLKNDLESFLLKYCGISPWTKNPEEKKLIRDVLVWYGCVKRKMGDGKYWIYGAEDKVNEVLNKISEDKHDRLVFLISDGRFGNEVEWIHSKEGYFIHIAKYTKELLEEIRKKYDKLNIPDDITFRIFTPPANEEERNNNPVILSMSDYKLEWENINKNNDISDEDLINNDYLNNEVLTALKQSKLFTELL